MAGGKKRLVAAPTSQQLSLWGEQLEQVQVHCRVEPLVTVEGPNIMAMQEWLYNWGKKHGFPGFAFPFDLAASRRDYCYPMDDRRWGRMFHGERGWVECLTSPHCGQRERYPGEWLQKAVELCQRIDRGETSIPPQVYDQSGEDD